MTEQERDEIERNINSAMALGLDTLADPQSTNQAALSKAIVDLSTAVEHLLKEIAPLKNS